MRLIERKDIERWAGQYDSKGNFPILVSRLVHASTPVGTEVDFPSGSAVFTGGWDGVVRSGEDLGYVPAGISLWELGTEANPKGKADRDYKKRTADPDGFECASCTYVFVTARFWSQKEKWRKERLAEGKWKDIRVYDSSSLEQWLDGTGAVSRWFSSYLAKYPLDGMLTIEEFWKEWAVGPMGTLPPQTVTAGRAFEMQALQAFLNGVAGIKAVQASSKEEAIAFVIAAALQFDALDKDRFVSKSLIIDTVGNFRSIRINARALNLIVRFNEPQALYAAAAADHHVLLPMGPDDTFSQDVIKLPTIDRDGQVKALLQMGLSELDAERFSREAGRNLTILKRLLRFPQHKLTWLTDTRVREIIPVVLIGRWNENKQGDQELLGLLAQSSYDAYRPLATKWLSIEETPLIKIGELWRLLSPLDAWTTLSRYLTSEDMERLGTVFDRAFGLGNPLAIAKTERERLIFEFNNEKTYSSWAREGILQSMILVGLYGQQLQLATAVDAQGWVDQKVRGLLLEASPALWISLGDEMPLLAEASPEEFLSLVEKSLDSSEKHVMGLFQESEGLFHKNSHHSGLLWALESLAWLPEYFGDSVLVLAKLAQLDPGGELANRPLNSLIEIFKPWHHQSLASFEEREQALRLMCKTVPEVGRQVLLTMLPDSHGVAHPTYKMRWRVFNFNFNQGYTYQDIWRANGLAIDMLVELFDGSDRQLAELLHRSEDMDEQDRAKLFGLGSSFAGKLTGDGCESWSEIRRILSRHRSHPETDWALPPEILLAYETLYDQLAPSDLFGKAIWLFDDWPEFPDGNTYDEAQEQKAVEARDLALREILEAEGLAGVLQLNARVKEPWTLGRTLANVVEDPLQIKQLLTMIDDSQPAQVAFIQNFLSVQKPQRNLDWEKELYWFMSGEGFTTTALGNFLIALSASQALWDFIDGLPREVINYYWQRISPYLFRVTLEEKIHAIGRLTDYHRFFTAIAQANHILKEFPSEKLVDLLEQAAMKEASEKGNFDHHLERLLDSMESREDIDIEKKVRLEWMYMPVLARFNSKRGPENLHAELAKSPSFFVEVLTWLYRPKSDKQIGEGTDELTQEMTLNRAASARKLLNSWQKVPGVDVQGRIDEKFLNDWVQKVITLAKAADREEVAEMHLGQILANYPAIGESWPPEPISALMEKLKSDTLDRQFSVTLINQRGATSRGVFEGGRIERGFADYFLNLSAQHKNKHLRLAKLFKRLSVKYLHDAVRMDEEAERSKMEH